MRRMPDGKQYSLLIITISKMGQLSKNKAHFEGNDREITKKEAEEFFEWIIKEYTGKSK
ncbi:MAG: hypothetical protein GXO64_04985 [Candidatus Micrarchaeota archaeon]|nr:hypothetical protein [Candidatus Micrarchaeota archaeon]